MSLQSAEPPRHYRDRAENVRPPTSAPDPRWTQARAARNAIGRQIQAGEPGTATEKNSAMDDKRTRWSSTLATIASLLVLSSGGCAPENTADPVGMTPNAGHRVAAIPAAPAAEPHLVSAPERAFRDRLANRFLPQIEALAADLRVVAAVAEANRTNLATEQEILAKDLLWRQARGAEDPLIAPYLANPCAEFLKQTQELTPAFAEVFVMDCKGCIVAESTKTSDYWQGDEAKWTESYHGGVGKVFVDEIQYDHSSQAYVVQISVPVRAADGRTIGAMTVGVAVKDR